MRRRLAAALQNALGMMIPNPDMNEDFRFDNCRPDADSPLIGWICSYTPEELILAAGFIPYRIGPAGAGTGSDAYLPANLCPYVRSLLEAGRTAARGLRGVIFVDSCDAMRRLGDIWSGYSGIRILYRLDCPRRCDEAAENYLMARYRELLSVLEQESGRPVHTDDIRQAVEILNETRRLIGRIAALRRTPGSSLGGASFPEIARCAVQSDKSRFNMEACRFLAARNSRGQELSLLPKVLLGGCAVHGTEIHTLIEDCGIRVAVDDLCTGERHFHGLVDTSLDPLRGISRRYLQRRSCARMKGASPRVGSLIDLAGESEVDGIIFLTLKFCDLVQSDLPRIREAAHDRGFPLLHIERESLNSTGGQLRTRIQAFAEMLEKRQ